MHLPTRVSLLHALLCGIATIGASCGSSVRLYVHDQTVELARQPLPGGGPGEVVYRLFPGGGGSPAIHRTETVDIEVGFLGIEVRKLNRAEAERRGASAWQGVVVRRVRAGKPAARAGLQTDDVLVSLGGQVVATPEHFTELVESQVAPGEPLELIVLRGGVEEVLEVIPDARPISISETDAIPLETEELVQRYTGLQVATVPPDLAQEIFSESEPITLVSGVITGSPAYMEGLRGGDRVYACDGQPVASGADLTYAVQERVNRSRRDAIPVMVEGPLGAHTAKLEIDRSMFESAAFHFPILVDYESDVDSTNWSVLDFIFQFGGNYRGRYVPSATREPAQSSWLSLFPLGMFEFERTPTRKRTTLFWLITFRSKR